ncbi:MAG: histidine kinase [Cytophagaceae bacterium]|jgi:sensor histidine kinase YesM|nr:histidine kinase [Cytophagaceae bacterium]
MNTRDWRIHAAGILILSVVITVVVYEMLGGELHSIVAKFFIVLFNTSVLWIGNSLLFMYLLKTFPRLEDTRKRIIYEVISMTILTTILSTGAFYVICVIPYNIPFVKFFNNLKYSLLFTALAVIFHESIYFFQKWKESLIASEKLQRESMQAQLESLQTQVNPHFLFNSLNTLIALIPQDAKKSVDFVRKLSEVYRYLLRSKNSELISVEEEMDMVKSYFFLLETRFQEGFHTSIQLSEQTYQKFLPPISIQMLIENCVKHNVISKEHPLFVEILELDGWLIVRNNKQVKQDKEASTGLGLMNIQRRYQLLSNKEVVVENSESIFSVRLPLLEIQYYA